MEQDTNTYSTRDLYFASYLLATGHNLLDIFFDESGRFSWFQFESDVSHCEEQDRLFQTNKLSVKAKDFVESIKFLKRKVTQ